MGQRFTLKHMKQRDKKKASMDIALIPDPKKIQLRAGDFSIPTTASIGIESHALTTAAEATGLLFRRVSVHASAPAVRDDVSLSLDPGLKPGGYRLTIAARDIRIVGQTQAAAMHAVHTLGQIVRQSPRDTLPCLRIDDWPDFEDRGVYYDVCRGRVPKLERLLELAEQLAYYKINQLQLYIEHTFAFRAHPRIGKGASPLTAEDILELDAHCAANGIELVPSLATFGHMSNIMKWPEYRHMAEDLGIGKYVAKKDGKAWAPPWRGWTLSPAVPEVYEFLDSLFAEFLPLFRSDRFNICGDETWDLGLGQSFELCKRKGRGVVYLEHTKKVRNLARKYGKRVMFWGDIIRHYPELVDRIPRDVTVLDWGYAYDYPVDRIKHFKASGLPFYACPGTSGWVSLFPRLPEAMENIARYAKAGARHGARGLLNTDWGDGGHYNFMEFSWHGYLFGAEQAWNTKADRVSFTRRFVKLFLNSDSAALAQAITTLGDVSFTSALGYQSALRHVFFATPDSDFLQHDKPSKLLVSQNGHIRVRKMCFDAAFGRSVQQQLRPARKTFEAHTKVKGCDPQGVLPYWIFAVDTLSHAGKKLAVLGPGGRDTKAARRALKQEMRGLMRRFEKLWMARNRRSEIRMTLNEYRKVIASL